jgi:serine/threonine-protein kinase RsbW
MVRFQPWMDRIANRLGLAEETRFAVDLCVEEAVANVILHGYRSEPGHPIIIRNSVSAGSLCITIDDQAPPFPAIESQSRLPHDKLNPISLETAIPGGNGIMLLHKFAKSLSYERLLDSNRLTLFFCLGPMPSISRTLTA